MALLSRYAKLHALRYGARPEHNINREQWSADNLVESYTLYGCYDLLDYYFDVSQAPSWRYFANYADQVLKAQKDIKKDNDERAERRRMARLWLHE
jgi:hypothetical protein